MVVSLPALRVHQVNKINHLCCDTINLCSQLSSFAYLKWCFFFFCVCGEMNTIAFYKCLNFHVMLAGKVYDFVNYFAQEPDETVFVSSTEPKIGKHP